MCSSTSQHQTRPGMMTRYSSQIPDATELTIDRLTHPPTRAHLQEHPADKHVSLIHTNRHHRCPRGSPLSFFVFDEVGHGLPGPLSVLASPPYQPGTAPSPRTCRPHGVGAVHRLKRIDEWHSPLSRARSRLNMPRSPCRCLQPPVVSHPVSCACLDHRALINDE